MDFANGSLSRTPRLAVSTFQHLATTNAVDPEVTNQDFSTCLERPDGLRRRKRLKGWCFWAVSFAATGFRRPTWKLSEVRWKMRKTPLQPMGAKHLPSPWRIYPVKRQQRRPGGSMMEERFLGKVALKWAFGESSEPGFCKNGDWLAFAWLWIQCFSGVMCGWIVKPEFWMYAMYALCFMGQSEDQRQLDNDVKRCQKTHCLLIWHNRNPGQFRDDLNALWWCRS